MQAPSSTVNLKPHQNEWTPLPNASAEETLEIARQARENKQFVAEFRDGFIRYWEENESW